MEIILSNPTPIIVALIAVLGAFAVQRYSAYRTASAKFRATFLDSLAGLYPTFISWDGGSINYVLKEKFPVLQAAVTDFSASLPWWRRRAFNDAWIRYCNATGRDCDINTYLHYFDAYDPVKSTQEQATAKAQALFHSNVSAILKFANET